MPKTLYVGIDVSAERHDICLLSDNGDPLGKPFAVDNNLPGAEMLVDRLAQTALGYDRVLAGMEATGIYWYHLARYLASSPRLTNPQVQVITINPKQIKAFREAYSAMEKTDPKDAFLIADRLRLGHLPSYQAPDPRYLPLQRLTRYRYHLVHTLVRTKCHALAQLFLLASEYQRLKPFSDSFGTTSMAVLTDYKSLSELASAPLEQLAEFIDEAGRHAFADPLKPAAILKEVAAHSFQLDAAAVEPIHFALRDALAHVEFLKRRLDALDRRIAQELEHFPNTLTSVPGLGPVYVAGLIAEIADADRFPDDDAVAKQAGLWWPRTQSGQFEAEDKQLSKEGNKYLRYYLCEAAYSLSLHNPEYAAYYNQKYRETRKHAQKRATVLTARKLVRLVYALLRTGQNYANPDARSAAKSKR